LKFSLGSNLRASNRAIRRPIGIITTFDEEKILATDYEGKCVNVFNASNGKFINKMCENKLLGPKGISLNSKNQIVIADAKGNSVFIYDSNGKFLRKFGMLGRKNENFSGPQYVFCNKCNDDIIISDFYNHCIKVFDSTGNFKFTFGSNGISPGQFNGPTGVLVDNFDNIIAVDWGNSRIQVFKQRKLIFIFCLDTYASFVNLKKHFDF
jgi:tripartite motif-containing protein 2/3